MQRNAKKLVWVLLLLAHICRPAIAQDFTVDSLVDLVDADVNDGYCITAENTCTLRAAVQQANANPGYDRILLPAGLYSLTTISSTGIDENAAASGDLDITSDMDIIGLGASPTDIPTPDDSVLSIIDGINSSRIIEIRGNVSVKLQNMVLQHGYEALSTGGAILVYQANTVELTRLSLRDNEAYYTGGGLDIASPSVESIVIRRCDFIRNTAKTNYGGGIYASTMLTLIDSKVQDNFAVRGGGIFARAAVIVDSDITGNRAGAAGQSVGYGGGIYGGSISGLVGVPYELFYVYHSRIANNTSSSSGGGMFVTGGDTQLNRIRVENNRADISGGGLMALDRITLYDSIVNQNSAGQRGGGMLYSGRTATIEYSAFTNNTVENSGGLPAVGGGIYIGGLASITNSTISGNQAIGVDSAGGGVHLNSYISTSTNTELTSSVTITHATIANNQAVSGGNLDIQASNSGGFVFSNSILAHATDNTNCGPEIINASAIHSASSNISSDASCAVESVSWTIANPLLLVLDDADINSSFTHALADQSPAINKAIASCVVTDQRFYIQDVTDGFCDIGAYSLSATKASSGVLQFSKDRSLGETYITSEASGLVTLVVNRTDGDKGEVTVFYRTLAGSASASDADFIDQHGSLVFGDGIMSKPIQISVRTDSKYEVDENFFVELYDPHGGVALGTASVAEVVITDDGRFSPQHGSFAVASSPISVGEGQRAIMVKVSRNLGSDGPVSVDYTESTAVTKNAATNMVDFRLNPGTLQFAHGETEKAIIVELIDDAIYEGDEHMDIVLSNPTGGATLSLNKRASMTIVENDPRPWDIGFLLSSDSVNEGDGSYDALVRATNGSSSGVATADYKITGGTATQGNGGDYILAEGTLTFNLVGGSSTVLRIPITILEDIAYEGTEAIVLELYNLQTNVPAVLSSTETVISIFDNESPPPRPGEVGFSNSDYQVSESIGEFAVQVNRNNGAEGVVTVNYSVVGGTAASVEDYVVASGELTFAAGVTQQSFSIAIVDDVLPELDESIVLQLSSPTGGATLGQTTATIHIVTNDQPAPVPGVLDFQSTSLSVNEAQYGVIAIPIQRLNGSDGIASVSYAITGGSAVNNQDYFLSNGFVSFKAGETSRNIYLTVLDDFDNEGDETIEITLSDPQSAVLGQNKVMTVTIIDDDANGGKPGGSPSSGSGGGSMDLIWFWVGLYAICCRRRERYRMWRTD